MVSVLILACAIRRTCLGLAITTRFTCGPITLATAAALPVASTTTTSSLDKVAAKALSRSRRMAMRPNRLSLPSLPGHRLSKGAVDVQSDDAHAGSLRALLVAIGSRRATRHLLI